jgi:asparagine synthase (glutamine-hydrolysing)
MCGISGAFFREEGSRESLLETAISMSGCVVHRGPDDAGEFADARSGLAFGFRRLAIIDLTPAGHQPMESASGRYVVMLNGEVYNFETLRDELARTGRAPEWRGHSDTEVLLAAFEAYGVDAAVQRFVGMFAIALWDRQEQVLHLIRDRIGVKPLYYAFFGRSVLFGSELKSLAANPAFRPQIAPGAVALYARYGYVPAPFTIYESVWKLPPGTILSVTRAGERPEPKAYWSVADVAERGAANLFQGTEEEALEELDRLVNESVRLRMISDVPLGVFLSGGIDSSTVAAVMQHQNTAPVKTFTIGFGEQTYNEATFASAVAKHLRTDHTELYVTPNEAMDVIPLLARMYDEPFADVSQIPTYLVSKLARRSVTVSLSGDGGDELFGGYARYFLGRLLLDKVQTVPRPFRSLVSMALQAVPVSAWNRLFDPEHSLLPRSLRRERAGWRLHHLASTMRSPDPDSLYRGVVSLSTDLVPFTTLPETGITDPRAWPKLSDATERMMFFDQISYLPDDILVKVDRASMAVSLEAREPLLDHRLIEFAWTLPLRMKIRGREGKWILKELLARYVPRELVDRPKMGFGVPIGRWMRGPLRDWAESLLDPTRLRSDGYFDAALVRNRWEEHLEAREEWDSQIWSVVMFQAWLDTWRSPVPAPTGQFVRSRVLP